MPAFPKHTHTHTSQGSKSKKEMGSFYTLFHADGKYNKSSTQQEKLDSKGKHTIVALHRIFLHVSSHSILF